MPDSFDDAASHISEGYGHAQTRRPGDRLRALVGASRNMVVSLAGDVGLPIAAYAIAELCGFSTYVSLLAGTVVAAIRMAWVAFRDRRLDVFATAGLIFLGSCIIKRPLAFYAARRFAGATGSAEFLATADTPAMRRRWYTVSLVWGLGLIIDAALRMTAAYRLPPDTAVNVAQVLTVVAYGLLIGWTVLTAKQQSRKPRLAS